MSANETQVGGDHYKSKAIQPWDYIASNNIGYLEGCIIKYISRHREKGGLEDLKKAEHFLAKLIEVETDRTPKISRGELLKEILPGVNELFGIEYAKQPVKAPVKRGRGRPRKAPYGLKANGQPYVRRPRDWKEEQK